MPSRLSRYRAYIERNPVSPILAILMGAILLVQLLVAGYSIALFDFLFVANGELSPGLLLAPISHGTFITHYLPNMGLLLLCGWPMENYISTEEFLGFVIFTAYIPTYLQIVYSITTAGVAGTLGFSGAVYAFPPALLCASVRGVRSAEKNFDVFGQIAFGITVAMPFSILGLLNATSGLPSADITHAMGYALGWVYGVLLLSSSARSNV